MIIYSAIHHNICIIVKLWYNLYIFVTIGYDYELKFKFLEVKILFVIPTLHCAGRCEEAIALYKKAFNLEIDWQEKDE